jgi:hypothetical protein
MRRPRPWTVLPHGPLVELGPALLAVEARLPSGHVPRRMLVARRSDGDLAFYNAIPLAEQEMRAVDSFGRPGFLIVPSGLHRLDLHAFKERYPALQILCPAPIRAQVEKAVPIDGDLALFPADPAVALVPVRGTKTEEPVLVVRGDGSTALGFGDLVMNLVELGGLDGLLFKLLGSVGGPRVTPIAKRFIVRDRAAVRQHLEELAELPGLALLVPTHGEIVSRDAAGVLRKIAAEL